jgi:hypothetical protein
MTLRDGVVGYRRFGGTVYLVNSAIFTLENEASFEKSVFDDFVTQRHVPDDGNSQLHLKPLKVGTVAPSVTRFEI